MRPLLLQVQPSPAHEPQKRIILDYPTSTDFAAREVSNHMFLTSDTIGSNDRSPQYEMTGWTRAVSSRMVPCETRITDVRTETTDDS